MILLSFAKRLSATRCFVRGGASPKPARSQPERNVGAGIVSFADAVREGWPASHSASEFYASRPWMRLPGSQLVEQDERRPVLPAEGSRAVEAPPTGRTDLPSRLDRRGLRALAGDRRVHRVGDELLRIVGADARARREAALAHRTDAARQAARRLRPSPGRGRASSRPRGSTRSSLSGYSFRAHVGQTMPLRCPGCAVLRFSCGRGAGCLLGALHALLVRLRGAPSRAPSASPRAAPPPAAVAPRRRSPPPSRAHRRASAAARTRALRPRA